MITIYILYLIILPILILWKSYFIDRSDEKSFLSKEDTLELKGISAFFVMAAHYMVWVGEMIRCTTNTLVKGVIGQLGGIGVLIFFFVSGYGLYESYGYIDVNNTYLLRRLKGVYFPYIIIKIMFLIIYHTLGLSSGNIVSELASIVLMEDWFIHIIVILYIVFFVAAYINKKHMITINIAADSILTVIFVCQNKPDRWFNALWLFSFGMFVSKYQTNIIKIFKKYNWYLLVIFLVGFVLAGSIFALNKGYIWANIFKPISGMFLCISICIIMRKYKLSSPVNMWAGKRSMHLYVIHIAIWNLIQIRNPMIKVWIALFVSIMATEIMYEITSYICNKCFRKINKIL